MNSPFALNAARGSVVWTTAEGIGCVIAPYEDTRYQLRLVHPEGTIKADFFTSRADALAAADCWRGDFNRHAP